VLRKWITPYHYSTNPLDYSHQFAHLLHYYIIRLMQYGKISITPTFSTDFNEHLC
jgi:hypothetical protein